MRCRRNGAHAAPPFVLTRVSQNETAKDRESSEQRKQESGRGERKRASGCGVCETWKAKVNLREQTIRKAAERASARCDTSVRAETGERMRARPMDATSPSAHRPALYTRH